MEELLISLVRENPPIYDKANKEYKKRGAGGTVSNIWASIKGELSLQGHDCDGKHFCQRINDASPYTVG